MKMRQVEMRQVAEDEFKFWNGGPDPTPCPACGHREDVHNLGCDECEKAGGQCPREAERIREF